MSQSTKADIAVAIIAKNAEKTIGACLDSIVPFVRQVVVCVDGNTKDATARIAKRHGATVYRDFRVSEIHECPEHGSISVQHFAKARNESFARLRKEVAWLMWLDADDTLRGGDKLKPLLDGLAPDVAGVWLPYFYATAGKNGPPSTLFDRERIVRASMPWAWVHRVHEVLAPVGIPTEALNWTRTEDISVHHISEGHDTQGSARRNITLLEIDLEENPEDMRAWFYLGNQYFALQEWEHAAHCFDRACQSDNPYQLWQTLIYLSMACEKLGDVEQAEINALKALRVQPAHPDPYYRLAVCSMLQLDVERCEFWTRLGDQMPPPPPFVFRNPLDRPYNARLTLAQAYANNGQATKARQQLEVAAQVVPSPMVQEGIAFHKKLEEDALLADSWVRIIQQAPELASRQYIPNDAWRFGRVRDVVVPQLLKFTPGTQPRIVFFCGHPLEPWAPPSINKTGIGGSETAVIEIAKRFAADGWRVDVYNDCDHYEGVYEDVGYWDLRRLRQGERADVYVSWRNPQAYNLPIERAVSVLWMHDLNKGSATVHFGQWDRVLGVSSWHSDYLSNVYSLSNTAYAPNGINLDRFQADVKKTPFRCVYASSPDRGLDGLLHMWPAIVAQEPKAELHVAYGWESIDKSIAYGARQLIPFKQYIEHAIANTPGVVWRGRLPQNELAKLYAESYALLYPTDFLEVSCIVAMEAMAAGCAVVTSGVGALPETVGDGGAVVKGNVYTRAWREYYTYIARGVLHAPDVRQHYEQAGKERAKALTWDASYQEHWKPLIAGLLEGKTETKELVLA